MNSVHGMHRLIFINSGTYASSVFPVDMPLSICGRNNSGKSTAVNALQFLFLADMRDMEFGKHDHLTTRKFYFPGPGSYVLGEVHLQHGTFVIGAGGTGAAAQHHLQHFVYEGEFKAEDFRFTTESGENRVLQLKEFLQSLKRRGVAYCRLHPHELRNALLGVPGDCPFDLTMVPLRGHQERYQNAWVTIFKNLIHMRNVNSQDLKHLLLHIFDIRLVASDIDFAQEYQRVNRDVDRLSAEIETLEKLRPHVEDLVSHHEDRQVWRGKLKASYFEIHDRLAKWRDFHDHDRSRLTARLASIDPEMAECRRQHEIAAAAMRETSQEFGILSQWLTDMRQREAEFELVADLDSVDRELAMLETERDEVVKAIGAGERAVPARLVEDIRRIEARVVRIDAALAHWDENVWGVLNNHFKAEELVQLFALLNHEILHLPLNRDGGVKVLDEKALVAAIRDLLDCIENGVYHDEGVSVALGSLTSQSPQTMQNRDFLETERKNLFGRLGGLEKDLTAAKEIQKLTRRGDELAALVVEKRKFRERFSEYLFEREKMPVRLPRHSELEEETEALADRLRQLRSRERDLEKERQQAVSGRNALDRRRQKFEALQERVEPLPESEPEGTKFDEPFPDDLEEFMEDYVLDLQDKGRADEVIQNRLDAVEMAGGGTYLRNSEKDSVTALQEAMLSLPQRTELLDKAKRTAVAELGNTLKGLRDNYRRLESEIDAFNAAINRRTVSNLTRIELRLDRNERVMGAIEELVKAGDLKLFADESKASEAAAFLFEWVGNQGRKLNLTHLFELSFAVFTHDGRETVYRNLDRIESHGTTITIKALVNMHLMSHLLEEGRVGNVHMPYYIDEAASIDQKNQEILIDQGRALGFMPVLASVKPQPTATYCVKVDDTDGDGHLVIDETSWIVLERKLGEKNAEPPTSN